MDSVLFLQSNHQEKVMFEKLCSTIIHGIKYTCSSNSASVEYGDHVMIVRKLVFQSSDVVRTILSHPCLYS
jgi:hypothetical protein